MGGGVGRRRSAGTRCHPRDTQLGDVVVITGNPDGIPRTIEFAW